MNELRFFEALGMIDDDLLREADISVAAPVSSRRNITAAVSVAAAAALTLGAVALINGQRAKDMLTPPEQPVLSGTPSSGGDNTPAVETSTETSTAAASAEEATTEANTVSSAVSTTDAADIPDDIGPANAQDTAVHPPAAVTASASSAVRKNTQTSLTSRTGHSSVRETTAATTAPVTQPVTESSAVHKGGVDASGCYWQPFTGYIDPDTDSYGEDEEHHVDIRTAEGFYRQLSTDEYQAQGIKMDISLSDFGGYIGRIAEVDSTSEYHGISGAESQAPSLAGADAYYYAPAGNNKAFIIVRKGEQCSIFMDNHTDTASGFRKGMAFFGIVEADGIQSIEYTISVPENGLFVVSEQDTITDPERIKAVYDILCELVPEDYSKLPEHIGTPPWLAAAYEAYRNDPAAPQRTDHRITIRLKDGTVLDGIMYQPYIGNGYVEGMEELTPEQNAALRELV